MSYIFFTNFLIRQKFISFIKYILYTIYIYAYKTFSITLDKALRKDIKKKRWRYWKT